MSAVQQVLIGSAVSRVTSNISISADQVFGYTLNTAKVTGYVAGLTDVTLTINSGIYTSTLTVDTSWATGDVVHVVNNGNIFGKGGGAGSGGVGVQGGNATGGLGIDGGAALQVLRTTKVTNNGVIAGGGGGGRGGDGFYTINWDGSYGAGGGGGGGGQGFPNGSGGNGGSAIADFAAAGDNGTSGYNLSPGIGGAGGWAYGYSGGSGYEGGSLGAAAPVLGGAGGYCTDVGSNALINWLVTGTRYGTIA
jgi:hypothetical protein